MKFKWQNIVFLFYTWAKFWPKIVIITDFIDINTWWEKISRLEIFWRYFIFNLAENLNMKWVNAQMAYNRLSYLTHLK